MFLLIDTRNPPPPQERPAWEPNWRLWGWVAATIAVFVAANDTSGVLSYALAFATLACTCRAVLVVLPPLDGLRDYRQ